MNGQTRMLSNKDQRYKQEPSTIQWRHSGVLGIFLWFCRHGFSSGSKYAEHAITNISVSIQELLSLSVQRVYACDVQNWARTSVIHEKHKIVKSYDRTIWCNLPKFIVKTASSKHVYTPCHEKLAKRRASLESNPKEIFSGCRESGVLSRSHFCFLATSVAPIC